MRTEERLSLTEGDTFSPLGNQYLRHLFMKRLYGGRQTYVPVLALLC